MKRITMAVAVIVIIAATAVVMYGNKYMVAKTGPASALAGTISSEKVKIISQGETVNLTDYLVKDKVVVFDFYADWCGPCRVLGPRVEELVQKYDDVVLRKINIVNWTSAVSKQYQIQFVPNVRVYDKQGQQVGEPTPNYDAIAADVAQARK